jgi:hypothetical protein
MRRKKPIVVPSMQLDEDDWRPTSDTDFSGGENLKTAPEFIADNQVIRAYNCVLSPEVPFQTRLGKTKVNTTSLGSGSIISLHRYSKEDGSKYLVAQHGTELRPKSWDGSTPFATFDASVRTVDSAKLRKVVWKDQLILGNGVDNLFRFDGTTTTDLLGSPPKSKILAIYASRAWAVDEDNPSFLRFSDREDYDSWPALNVIKVRDGDGDRIIGLSAQAEGLMIFKQKTVWPLFGTNKDNFRIPLAPLANTGAISTDAIIDEGVFLGNDNLYSFSLNSISPLSETHTPLFDQMSIAQKQSTFMIAHTGERRAVLWLGDTELNTLVIHGDYNGAITTWKKINAACFEEANDKDDPGTLLFGDASDGFVYGNIGDDDDGSPITTRITFPYRDNGTSFDKIWRIFRPTLEPVGVSPLFRIYYKWDVDFVKGEMFSRSYDNRELTWGVDEWGNANWGDSARISDLFFLDLARGKRIGFEIITTVRIKFFGFTTRYRIVGDMP